MTRNVCHGKFLCFAYCVWISVECLFNMREREKERERESHDTYAFSRHPVPYVRSDVKTSSFDVKTFSCEVKTYTKGNKVRLIPFM